MIKYEQPKERLKSFKRYSYLQYLVAISYWGEKCIFSLTQADSF